MTRLLISLLTLFTISCQSSDKYSINHYYNQSEKDTLLTNIITYIYQKAPNSDNQTRFNPEFRNFYKNQLSKFSFQNYFIDKDSTHYFFVIRPVGNLPYKRGVIGRYRLDQNLEPIDFEEVVNTPHLKEAELAERGNFLLKELIKNKNLDKYYTMKHYVEWPDKHLVYNKKVNEWVNRYEVESKQ